MIQKHRISTNIGVDQKITVELKQDFDVLEILSLKFSQKEIYTSMCSDYGVVCGRVTANNGFGLGNVRVSIFVPLTTEDEDDPVISTLYPYKEVTDKDENNYRYNLLPSRQQHSGHANTGTFPDQSNILEREEVLEVYEKYYKYTVKTNSAGDFMIWGVPIGAQTIHMDADLSDVGCFSLRPYDFIRQGIGVDGFKNKYSFKASEDLNSLPQIISIDKIIQVYPFWGNESLCEIGITRTDFDLTEKGVNIQPKAYVIGGIFTDGGKNAINKGCTPRRKMGRKCDMAAKSGKIEAIRFTSQKDDNHYPRLEVVNLDEDIPDDGGFVLPLEMNMDYVITNEFGENEITNDPNKGIPTSSCYRLRINMNDKDLTRVRFNADYLLPNIREYQTTETVGGTTYQIPDDKSYAFSTNLNDYPAGALSLILNNEGGEYYPQDYFYRFTYNKVYTVSSFQEHYYGTNLLGQIGFANVNDATPGEEEDCGDKLTPPSNFGIKKYTFLLLVADFLLILDYVIKFLTLQFLNIATFFLSWVAETIISISWSDRSFLRHAVTEFQINNQTKLSLINYPECVECSDQASVGGGQSAPVIDYFNGGCSIYDTVYDDSLVTGYFIQDLTNNNKFNGCGSSVSYLPANYRRKYVQTLTSGDVVLSTAIYGEHEQNVPLSRYPYNNGDYNREIRDFSCQRWDYNGGFATQSARSEFYNGVFYIIPGTQTSIRLTKVINEYYRRKRVGKMFCGGIVNYGFIDSWLSGSLYFFQFKAKGVTNAVAKGNEKLIKYCRTLVRFVGNNINRFYYRSAKFSNGNFVPGNLNRATTFVDLGPRDEFIKEICIDRTLDPNCSVSRSIGATSYQDLGDLIGLAINYKMDIRGANANLDMFFTNKGFQNKLGLGDVFDGDVLQLLSINNEVGIDPFDLDNSKYIAYQFNVLDPELYPQVFKNGNAKYGPLPVTLDLKEDGERVRACLNEPTHIGYDGLQVQGRLTESSQRVPFYLWDKGAPGFGPYNEYSDSQSWDYSSVELQPLQGMTYGYNISGIPNDSSDKYLLLPMTYTYSGLTVTGDGTDQIDFDIIEYENNRYKYDLEYPGFTYLWVTGYTQQTASDGSGQIVPTSGILSTRVGPATSGFTYQGITITNGWHQQLWSSSVDFIIRPTFNYYNGNRQILSTPFQFYFGLMAGKTGMDKFVDMFGPKGAFNLLECDTTPPLPLSTITPSPTPTPTPTLTNTPTPTPTPTLNSSGLNTMTGVKSGVTLNLLCSGGGTDVITYFSGTSIQLGEKLYANNNLPNPTPVINGRYFYPTYNTIYVVTGGLGAVTSTEFCPSPTPLEYTIENIWTSDALTSNPTEQDLTYAVLDACNGTSNINSSAGLNGTATMTGWGNNICNALRVYNIPSLILSEVTSNGIIILRQTINDFDGSGGNKTWYRKYQRSLTKDSEDRYYFTPLGGCSECGVEPPPPTPIPQITVNIYGYQSAPYNEDFNNAQLVYQTYIAPNLGSVNTTSSGIKKILTESGSILVTPSVGAGGNLNLGVFKRVENDICDYMEVTANVFASGAFDSDRFNNSAGSLTQQTGCSQQGSIYGITISVSQSIDVYVTFGLPGFWSGIPPLPCLTTNE
jgi:hypothetical protein